MGKRFLGEPAQLDRSIKEELEACNQRGRVENAAPLVSFCKGGAPLILVLTPQIKSPADVDSRRRLQADALPGRASCGPPGRVRQSGCQSATHWPDSRQEPPSPAGSRHPLAPST